VTRRAKSILIVEDSEDIATSVAELLEDEGYEARSVPNGREALEYLASADPLPILILLDLMMPVMDGYEFRRLQRADARLSSIPVLLMTAGGEIKSKVNELQVEGHLKKPFFDISTILEAVQRFA
jgi:CheY-like chemotaxis protein